MAQDPVHPDLRRERRAIRPRAPAGRAPRGAGRVRGRRADRARLQGPGRRRLAPVGGRPRMLRHPGSHLADPHHREAVRRSRAEHQRLPPPHLRRLHLRAAILRAAGLLPAVAGGHHPGRRRGRPAHRPAGGLRQPRPADPGDQRAGPEPVRAFLSAPARVLRLRQARRPGLILSRGDSPAGCSRSGQRRPGPAGSPWRGGWRHRPVWLLARSCAPAPPSSCRSGWPGWREPR